MTPWPAGVNDEILFAADTVGHRRRLGARRQIEFPDFLAATGIEYVQRIVLRAAGDDEATCRHDGAAEVGRAGLLAERSAAKRHVPDLLPGEQVDGSYRTPWRRVTRNAVRGAQHLAIHRVWCSSLARILAETAAGIGLELDGELVLRDELYPGGESV